MPNFAMPRDDAILQRQREELKAQQAAEKAVKFGVKEESFDTN